MYTLFYGKLIFLKKLRLMYLKLFFIAFKICLLLIFWSFFLILILIIFILFYKFIKEYKNNYMLYFHLNGYCSFINLKKKFQENSINKEEINSVYIIDYSDEDIDESKIKSTEVFIDNPNNEEIEIIDDFYEIDIITEDINYNILFHNDLDAENNLIKGYVFYNNYNEKINLNEL
jgi:hypothetical protein